MMSPSDGQHTLGPGCELAPVPEAQEDAWLEGMPPNKAQFFYSSVVPIDDPLSTSTTDVKLSKLPLRPFSQTDNNALNRAWQQLSCEEDQENHEAARCARNPKPTLMKANEATLETIARNLAARHRLKHLREAAPEEDALTTVRVTLQGATTSIPVCCENLLADAEAELRALFCPLAVKRLPALGVSRMTQRVMVALKSVKRDQPRSESGDAAASPVMSLALASSPGANLRDAIRPIEEPRSSPDSTCTSTSVDESSTPHLFSQISGAATRAVRPPNTDLSTTTPKKVEPAPVRLIVPDDGISGKPFLRANIPSSSLQSPSPLISLSHSLSTKNALSDVSAKMTKNGRPNACPPEPFQQPHERLSELDISDQQTIEAALQHEIDTSAASLRSRVASVEVAVGISRLHTVSLPCLQMKPIYWSPVNDISIVQRATWFYRDTMMPLEVPVANQLESLYRELRPWSEMWQIELRCAIDLGPVGEEKITQPLWPAPVQVKFKMKADKAIQTESKISGGLYCASHCHQGAAAASGTLEPSGRIEVPVATGLDNTIAVHDADSVSSSTTADKAFTNYHVAFKNGQAAFLLKPSLRPSAYYGRRPFSKINKGATVGIPIVRGFDRCAWDRFHEQQKAVKAPAPAPAPAPASQSSSALGTNINDETHGPPSCPGCKADKAKNQVSDLVLVIHGVGQKLAERVESFHFTHAVNGLRRAIGAELKNPIVQSVLRSDHQGIMVLPVNWRHTLSFEDGGFPEAQGQPAPSSTTSSFDLKDIEPNSIPAVRSMISDVMFDIPFYMSHHKPKMISSLIREANRVYRLWCDNNPGFSKSGRVHLIGHSLGSAMAIEVLSRQPTAIPQSMASSSSPETDYFEFDTKNLFLLGSPAAFFLLLERGALIPRRGRQKPGVDAHDHIDDRVVGEVGTFGCLAVDNIYNILAREDPIAYLLNGTIDTAYASSLRTAYVPSATVGFFASVGHSLKGFVFGPTQTPNAADVSLSHTPVTPSFVRLPSQLELEIHDFTREEMAERKAYLLNDNGQIDYYLQSNRGPLEIQYLNMLSAHTSYWTNHDLIRMLCTEIGRRPGKAHALPAMRAVKSLKRIVPNAS